MRYFTGPFAVFDAIRTQVIASLGQPNGRADEPWQQGITSLALSPHETEPPEYAALVASALQSGITEITEEQFAALHPNPTNQ